MRKSSHIYNFPTASPSGTLSHSLLVSGSSTSFSLQTHFLAALNHEGAKSLFFGIKSTRFSIFIRVNSSKIYDALLGEKNNYQNILIPFAWLHRTTNQTKLVCCYLFIKLSILMLHIHRCQYLLISINCTLLSP